MDSAGDATVSEDVVVVLGSAVAVLGSAVAVLCSALDVLGTLTTASVVVVVGLASPVPNTKNILK